MESYWFRVDPKSNMTGIHKEKWKCEHRDTQGITPRENKAGVGVMHP